VSEAAGHVVPRVGKAAPSGLNSVPTAGVGAGIEVPCGQAAVLTMLSPSRPN
jgi:hypothetical protein